MAQDEVGLQRPDHVTMGSDCALDWSHVPHLKSSEERQSWKNGSRDAVIQAPVASECIPYIILSANKTSKQQRSAGDSTGTQTPAGVGCSRV